MGIRSSEAGRGQVSWGPVDGFEPLLMPVVHALIQVREDIENLVARVPAEHTWERR